MSDRHDDEEHWFDDDDLAVRRRSPVVRVVALLVVAAMVLSVVWILVVVVTSSGSTEEVTAAQAPSPTPRSSEVTLEFELDPEGYGGTLVGTISNHSDEPWPLDCMVGTLSRKDGPGWTQAGDSAVWRTDDAQLFVYPGSSPGTDCGEALELLPPGQQVERRLYAEWIPASAEAEMMGVRQPLEAGSYRFEARLGDTAATGEFDWGGG